MAEGGHRVGRDRMRRASVQRRTPRWPFAVRRGSAHPLEVLARVQPRSDSAQPGPLGPAQGHRRTRHRRLHPSRLVRPPARDAAPGRARPVPAQPGGGAGHRPPAPAPAGQRGGGGPGPVHAQRGDLHDLQAGRPDPEGAPPGLPAGPGRGGAVQRRARADRQPRLGRAADPRSGLAGSAGDHPGGQPGRLSGAGAHLDPLVLRAGLEVRFRRHRRLLRRPGRACLRGGDRPLLRPGDELAGRQPGPLPVGVELRRALPAGAGPRGHRVRLGPRLLRHAGGAAYGGRAGRHHRVLPRGGQVPRRRAPALRRQLVAGADPGGRWTVPGVRQATDGGRTEPGGGAGRPARGAPAGARPRGDPSGAAGRDPR